MQRFAAIALLLFALPALGQVGGTVYNAQGQPLAGAAVRAYRLETPMEMLERIGGDRQRKALAETTSGEQGQFVLDTKVAGVVEVVVDAEGYLPARSVELSDEKDLSIALTRAVVQRGRITAGGKPVAGAVVLVAYNDGGSATTRSADDGSYSIRYHQQAVSAVEILHPGYARSSIAAQRLMGATPKFDVSLEGGQRVAGRVLSAGGSPAAKARLFIDQWPAGTTGEDGTFVIAHAPAKGTLYATIGSEVGTAPVAATIALRLAPAASVTGTVRDEKGHPVPGVLVTAGAGSDLGDDHPALPGWAVSDGKGSYRISGLASLSYAMQALGPATLQFPYASADLKRKRSVIHDFTAASTRFIRVTVVDHKKQPVGGAQVLVGAKGPLYYSALGQSQHIVTGANGRCRIAIPSGSDLGAPKISLAALHPGYPIASTMVEWKSGAAAPVVITLPEGIELQGIVADADGKPVSDTAIGIVQDPPAGAIPIDLAVMLGELAPWATSGPDGRFSIRLNRAVHDLGFTRDGYASTRAPDVNVQPGMAPLRVTLERGVEIRGRVVRKGAASLAGTILAHSEETAAFAVATIAEDGTFALTRLRPGTYTVQIDQDETRRTIQAPAKDVVIELQSQAEIRGKATDKASGMPLTAFQVRAEPRSGGEPLGEGINAADGAFVLHGPAGRYNVTVSAPGYLPTTLTDVAVEVGKSGPELALALVRGRKVHGRIGAADGSPLADASVERESRSNAVNSMEDSYGSSDEEGEYELRGLPPSEITIGFAHPGYLSAHKTIAAGSDDVQLDVTLAPGRKAGGRVVSESGTAVPGAEVTATPVAHGVASQSATSGADGTFIVEGLGGGRHSFSASKGGYESANIQDVDLDGGKPIVLTLKSRATATIHGRVSGISSKSWLGGMVHASGKGEGMGTAEIARDGSYRIEAAPVGEVEVRAQTIGMDSQSSSRPVTVTVAANSDVEVNLSFDNDTAVRGLVSRAGVPVPGAIVLFRQSQWTATWRTTARADGTYEIKGIEPGHYTVDVDLRNNTTYSVPYDVTGSATFDINASFVPLEGRVVDDSGTAVEGAIVSVEADDHSRSDSRQLLTSSSGAFGMDVQAGGSYRLNATKAGFASAGTLVDTRRTPTPVELKLQRGGGMRLRIVDGRDGTTLAGYVVVRNDAGVQLAHTNEPEPDGTFDLRLPDGGYRISVSAANYASQTVRATLPAGEQRIALTPGGTLVVHTDRDSRDLLRLVLPSGEEYVSCYCNGIADFHLTGKTTTLEHIAPGTYQLRLLDERGKLLSTTDAIVREGATSEVEVR